MSFSTALGGLCITSRDYPSLRDATRTGTLRVGVACAVRLQSLANRWRSLRFALTVLTNH